MFFITVSEMLGTNGEKIARKVAEELNYTFVGKEELEKAAAEMGFLADVQKVDEEKNPPLFERLLSERPKIYLERMQSVIYEIAEKGNTVFLGRGGTFLLQSFDCAFHVLVIGSMEKRIQRLIEEKQVGREIAEKIILRSDHDKKGFMRFAFHEDWLNPHRYDLILNTDKLSIDSATNMIINASKSSEIKECGVDSIKTFARLSLQRKIESALLEAGVVAPYLFFKLENTDSVILYGTVDSSEMRTKIEKVIKGMKGINKVKNELSITVTGT